MMMIFPKPNSGANWWKCTMDVNKGLSERKTENEKLKLLQRELKALRKSDRELCTNVNNNNTCVAALFFF